MTAKQLAVVPSSKEQKKKTRQASKHFKDKFLEQLTLGNIRSDMSSSIMNLRAQIASDAASPTITKRRRETIFKS